MAVSGPRSDTSGTCGYCGAHVSDTFCRTHGNNEDVAHRCPECDSWVRIGEGSAAGLDVAIPDPQEYAERSGGRWSA